MESNAKATMLLSVLLITIVAELSTVIDAEEIAAVTKFRFAGFHLQEIEPIVTPQPNTNYTWVIYGRINSKICIEIYFLNVAKYETMEIWEHESDDISKGHVLRSFRPGWDQRPPPFCSSPSAVVSVQWQTDSSVNTRIARIAYFAESPSKMVTTTVAPQVTSWSDRRFLYATVEHQWILYEAPGPRKNTSWIIENRDFQNETMCVYLAMVKANPLVCFSVWENNSERPDDRNSLVESCDVNSLHLNGPYCSKATYMSVNLHDPLKEQISFQLIYYIDASAPPVRNIYGSNQRQILSFADRNEPYQNATWLLIGRQNAQLCVYLNQAFLQGSEELAIWENEDDDLWNGHALRVFTSSDKEQGPFCTWSGYMLIHYKTASIGNDQAFVITYYMEKERVVLYATQEVQSVPYLRVMERNELKQDIIFDIESKDIKNSIMCVNLVLYEIAVPKGDCLSISSQNNQNPAEIDVLAASCAVRLFHFQGQHCRWTDRMYVNYNISVARGGSAMFVLNYYVQGRPPPVRRLYASKAVQHFTFAGTSELFLDTSWIVIGQNTSFLCFYFDKVKLEKGEELFIWENFDDNPSNGRFLRALKDAADEAEQYCTSLGFLSLHFKTKGHSNPEPFIMKYYITDVVVSWRPIQYRFAMFERQWLDEISNASYVKEMWFIYGRAKERLCMYIVWAELYKGDRLEVTEHYIDSYKPNKVLQRIENAWHEQAGPYCVTTQHISISLVTGKSQKYRSFRGFYYVERLTIAGTTPALVTEPSVQVMPDEIRYIYATYQDYQTVMFEQPIEHHGAKKSIAWIVENKGEPKDLLCVDLLTVSNNDGDCVSVWESRHNPTPADGQFVAVSCNLHSRPLEGLRCFRTRYMTVQYTPSSSQKGFTSLRLGYYIDARAPPVRMLFAAFEAQSFEYQHRGENLKNVTWLVAGRKNARLCIFLESVTVGRSEEVVIWENYETDPWNGVAMKVFNYQSNDEGPFCTWNGFMSVHYQTNGQENLDVFRLRYYSDDGTPVVVKPKRYYASYVHQLVYYDYRIDSETKQKQNLAF